MKAIVSGCLVLLFSIPLVARSIPATDSRVQYWGRTSASGAKVTFDWPGICILFNFTGTSCGVKISGGNLFNVWVDGVKKPQLTVSSNTSTAFTLASGLASGSHSVIISKRTESSWNTTTIDSIIVDNTGDLAAPPALPSRRIEYLGDSHAVGYANEYSSRTAANHDSVLYWSTNTWLSYTARSARTFGAQYFIEAISGMSLAQGGTHQFPYYWDYTLVSPRNSGGTSPTWNFASWKPDVVVTNFGINDANNGCDSATLFNAYRTLVNNIRTKYGNPVIICMASTQYGAEIAAPVAKQLVKIDSLAGKPIGFCSYGIPLSSLDWHPSSREDSVMAVILSNRIAKATGWSTSNVHYSAPKAVSPACRRSFSATHTGMVSLTALDLSGRLVFSRSVPVVSGKTYSMSSRDFQIPNNGLSIVKIYGAGIDVTQLAGKLD